jgi:hypothetical protein
MRRLLLVLVAALAIAAPVAAIDDLTPSVAPVPMLLAASEAAYAFPPDPVLCAPGGNWAGTDLCPESLPTPADPVEEMEIAGVLIIIGGFVLLLIFQALRPLLPERRAPQRRQKGNLPRSREKSSPFPFLLALSPILLVAALVFSMGLQLWEITGVVVALMAVFGLLAAVGIRYALGAHIATEVVQNANDSDRFYLINRFVPAIGPFAGKVDVVQPSRKRRRTTKGGAKAKPKR